MITLPARPESLTFAPQQSALIVVDMQNAYASQGGYLDLAGFDVSATRPVIDNINVAVAAARAAGMLIIWFQNGWDDQYVEAGGPGSPNFHKSNALKTMRKNPELQGKLLAKGGWDYQLVDQLKPQPGDIVLPKPRYSGFFNTALDSILRSRGIRHLADGVVYVSGTLPFDKQNNVVYIGDPKAQTRHVLETIKSVIETAGGSMTDVTFNSIFITDWKNYAAINEVYAEFFPGDKPARFCIQCGLVKPDALVEIATVAHIGKPA